MSSEGDGIWLMPVRLTVPRELWSRGSRSVWPGANNQGALVAADQHGCTAAWLKEMLRLVFNCWSIEASLRHEGDRSSGEDTQSLVLERNVQPGYSCPCEANLCRMPTGDHCHHYGGTSWGFVVSDPLLVIISSSDTVSEECLSASEVAS